MTVSSPSPNGEKRGADWRIGPRQLLSARSTEYLRVVWDFVHRVFPIFQERTMKRFFFVALLSCNLLVAGRTYAGPLLELHINQRGVAWFTNTGDEPVTFDGYQIQDAYEPGRLMPDYLRSVERVVAAGKIDEVLNVLGVGALGLATAGLSPSSIAELTAGMGGTLQPGRGWWLGQIFPHDLPVGAYPRDGLLGFSFLGMASARRFNRTSVSW
jgi:hypothetical protein